MFAVYVVGLDSESNADVIIRSLRAGATEFLATPFDSTSVEVVLRRIRKLCSTQVSDATINGKVFGFVGVKSGQGVTTLASNVAASLSQEGKRKTLLVDLDTMAGSLSFCWRLTHSYSVVDALAHADKLDDALWSALVTKRNGVDPNRIFRTCWIIAKAFTQMIAIAFIFSGTKVDIYYYQRQ